MRHRTVVSHRDQQCVLRNPKPLELIHELTDEGIDVVLHVVGVEAAGERLLFGAGHERGHHRPPGHVERLVGLGIAADEVHGPNLRLRVERVVVFLGRTAPFEAGFALLALDVTNVALRDEGVIELVGVLDEHVLLQAHRRVGRLAGLVVEAEDLVVDPEQRLVESLVVRVGLLDVAQVELAVEGGGVAGIRQRLGGRDLFGSHAGVLDGESDHVHAGSNRVPAGQHGRSAGCAAHLGVHPGKHDALFGHPIQARSLEAANLVDRWNPHVAKGRVVPHDMDDVGRCAVLGCAVRQASGVEFRVFGRPPLAVLGLEDVVLGVVDDLAALFCRHPASTEQNTSATDIRINEPVVFALHIASKVSFQSFLVGGCRRRIQFKNCSAHQYLPPDTGRA